MMSFLMYKQKQCLPSLLSHTKQDQQNTDKVDEYTRVYYTIFSIFECLIISIIIFKSLKAFSTLHKAFIKFLRMLVYILFFYLY